MSTVLIAGATGYLGRYAVKAFKRAGYTVRVLARTPEKLAREGSALAPAIQADVDEVHIGDVTKPESLTGICDGVDIVFSSISLMAQKSQLTWHDVDYLGNKNLLNEAEKSGVKKFIFVSVFNADLLADVPIVKAHEDFAVELAQSSLDYAIIRPTGFFSDMSQFYEMAASGRCFLFGDGSVQINPIHGADLAQFCVEAVDNPQKQLGIGGPKVYTWNKVARVAFDVVQNPTRVTHVPMWLAQLVVKTVGIFQPKTAQLWNFFVSSGAFDYIAPKTGDHTLEDHFRALKANAN